MRNNVADTPIIWVWLLDHLRKANNKNENILSQERTFKELLLIMKSSQTTEKLCLKMIVLMFWTFLNTNKRMYRVMCVNITWRWEKWIEGCDSATSYNVWSFTVNSIQIFKGLILVYQTTLTDISYITRFQWMWIEFIRIIKKSTPICRFSYNYFNRNSKRFRLRLSASISYLSLIILQVNGWMNYYIQFRDLIKNEKRRGWWKGKGIKWEARESKQGLGSKDERKSRGSMGSKKAIVWN